MDLLDVRNRDDVKFAGRCTLVANRHHINVFDVAFEEFWRVDPPGPDSGRVGTSQLLSKVAGQPAEPPPADDRKSPTEPSAEASSLSPSVELPESDHSHPESGRPIAVYSPFEAIKEKDFALYSDKELEDAKSISALHRVDGGRPPYPAPQEGKGRPSDRRQEGASPEPQAWR